MVERRRIISPCSSCAVFYTGIWGCSPASPMLPLCNLSRLLLPLTKQAATSSSTHSSNRDMGRVSSNAGKGKNLNLAPLQKEAKKTTAQKLTKGPDAGDTCCSCSEVLWFVHFTSVVPQSGDWIRFKLLLFLLYSCSKKCAYCYWCLKLLGKSSFNCSAMTQKMSKCSSHPFPSQKVQKIQKVSPFHSKELIKSPACKKGR